MIEFQTVTGKETPLVEDEGYIQAMINKADGVTETTPEPPTGEQTPNNEEKLYAGKYKSIEELERGYTELQKAYSSKQQVQTPKAETPETPDNPLAIPEGNEQTAEDVVTSAGLDFTEFSNEFVETGELSQASYDKLTKAGIPKDMVDAYIEGQRVIANQLATRVFDVAGGQEEYTKLTGWAAGNLTKQEIQAYNDVLNTGDVEQILIATRGLKATYEDVRGRTPQLIDGDASGSVNRSDTYTSKAQLTADMADPRYSKDASFRDEVAKKLSRSSIF